MHGHGRPGSPQDQAANAEFSREFGVFGSPDHAVQRLGALIEVGIDRFILRGSPIDPADPGSVASERFVNEVARQLKS